MNQDFLQPCSNDKLQNVGPGNEIGFLELEFFFEIILGLIKKADRIRF